LFLVVILPAGEDLLLAFAFVVALRWERGASAPRKSKKAALDLGFFYFKSTFCYVEFYQVRPYMRFVPLLLLLTLSDCHKPQQLNPQPTATETAVSTITTNHEGDATFPVVDNARFYVVSDYQFTSEKNVTLILTEHIITQIRTDRECCSAEINLSGAIDGKTIWTTYKQPSSGEMFGRFYRAAKPGCCGSTTHYSYFDPLTGNQAFIATDPIAWLSLAGRTAAESVNYNRYLALNRISEPGDDEFVLQIQYGPQSGPTQIEYIIHSGPDTAMSSTSVQYLEAGKFEDAYYQDREHIYPREYTLFPPGYSSRASSSPDEITGFFFLLHVDGTEEPIKIPVIKDHLDFDHATLPKDFRLTNALPAGSAKYLEYLHQ
jgi:hypothetical protein